MMVSQYGVPYEFCIEAVNIALYLVNNYSFSAVNFLTLFELIHKQTVDYNSLTIFACIAHTFMPNEHSIKLDSTSMRCHFIEFASDVKCYRQAWMY